jgi:hypothetical protein
MQFTRSAQETILKMIRDAPLKRSEYRRISGMGNMYLALSEGPENSEYTTFVTVELDGVPHRICKRIDGSA